MLAFIFFCFALIRSVVSKKAQIRISTATSTSPLFEYMRRFLEITFIVVVLYAVVKVIPNLGGGSSSQKSGAGNVASRQLSSLMVNMQASSA